MYTNVMENFQWGGVDAEGEIYMDENNRRMTTNIRLQLTNLAESFATSGASARGLEVLEKLVRVTPSRNVPYDRIMLPAIELLSEIAQDPGLTEEQRSLAGTLAKQVGAGTPSRRFLMMSATTLLWTTPIIRRLPVRFKWPWLWTQRISGSLSDALPDDEEVQAMAESMSQLRSAQSGPSTGPAFGPPCIQPGRRELMKGSAVKVAVLASGEGTNAERLIRAAAERADVDIAFVGSNRPAAGALRRRGIFGRAAVGLYQGGIVLR